MYTVVGCPGCRALWIREAGGDRTQCPACRRTHDVGRLRVLFEAEDVDDARNARTRLLAERADQEDAASFTELADEAADSLREDPEELTAFGLDPAELTAAAANDTDRRDRRQIVLDAIAETDPATADRILERATAEGVPPDAARTLLEKLRETGEATEQDGRFRLL